MQPKLKVEYMATGELAPYANNARTHDDAQVEEIAASIDQFGFSDPVGVWTRPDGVLEIVEGHGRVMAAKRLGLERVPVIRLDHLDDEGRRAYSIVHNKTTDDSSFDLATLEREMGELAGFDWSEFGFDVPEAGGEEIEELDLSRVFDDEVPDDVESRSRRGQLWALGDHRLMCGDSTDARDVARLMMGETADLLLTDPPYNVDVGSCERPNSSNDGVHIMNDHMGDAAFVEFLSRAFHAADSAMRPGGAWYVFYAGLNHSQFQAALDDVADWKTHEQLVWVKSHFVLGRNSDYQWAHEPILYGWKTGGAHYFTNSRAESTVVEDYQERLSTLKKDELVELCERLMGRSESTTVVRAGKPNAADLHPTVKPQAVLALLMRNSSRPGWIVLDLFGGSGSTMIAAEQLGRRARLMELDPHYCDVILQRWEKFTGRRAELLEDARESA